MANTDIEEASVIQGNDNSQYGVLVKLNSSAAEKMRAATESNVGKRLAIILDGDGASAVISGKFTEAQAQRIANGIFEK